MRISMAVLTLLCNMGIFTKSYGFVLEKTEEGGTMYNDYYLVEIDGECYEVESDDLEEDDEVTCYFWRDITIATVYGWR